MTDRLGIRNGNTIRLNASLAASEGHPRSGQVAISLRLKIRQKSPILLEAGRADAALHAFAGGSAANTVADRLLASRIASCESVAICLAQRPKPTPRSLSMRSTSPPGCNWAASSLVGNKPESALAIPAEGLKRTPDSTLLRLGEALAVNQLRRYEQALRHCFGSRLC